MNKLLLFFILFSACFQKDAGKEQWQKSENILIVFLSRTNNTKAVAELIQNKVGGDLVAVELENPYPENYNAIVKQVAHENETGFLPPLKTKVDMSRYNTIFLGFPTWGMQLPPPMKSFLHKNNLSGKTVIPFNTHGGYGVGSSFKAVKELCPYSNVLNGFTIEGGSERDGIYLAIKGDRKNEAERQVEKWLGELKLLEYKP
ncbi:MAG: flavodoxin [Maribacter sp.]|nr:flavodoxin [Maribacter sp.]